MTTHSDAGARSSGHVIFNLNVSLIIVTSVVTITRLYVRGIMTDLFGLDDAFAILSFGLAMSVSAIQLVQVGNGAGALMDDLSKEQIISFFSLLPVEQLLCVIALGLARLSISSFLPRLSRDRVFIRCVWAVSSAIVVLALAAFFFFLTECKPISDLFHPAKPDRNCISKKDEAYMMWTHSIVGVCIDAVLFGLPIWVIYKKMIFSSKAIRVILVFSVGLFAVVTGIVRFGIIVTTDFTTNTTAKYTRVATWTILEVHIGLWCGCFPAIQPLIRLISYELRFRSNLNSTNTGSRHGMGARSQTLSHGWPGSNSYARQHSATGGEVDDGSQRIITFSTSASGTEFTKLNEIGNGVKVQTDIVVNVEEGVHAKGHHETAWNAF